MNKIRNSNYCHSFVNNKALESDDVDLLIESPIELVLI